MAADVPVRQGREWSLVSDGILWECTGVRDSMAVWIKERVDVEGRKRKGVITHKFPNLICSKTHKHKDTCMVSCY